MFERYSKIMFHDLYQFVPYFENAGGSQTIAVAIRKRQPKMAKVFSGSQQLNHSQTLLAAL